MALGRKNIKHWTWIYDRHRPMQFLYFWPLLAPLTQTQQPIHTYSRARCMALRGTCLKLFQLLGIPLLSTACPRSITFPNNTTRPDNQSTKYKVSGLLFLRHVWDIEEIPFYKVAKGSCAEARGYSRLWTIWMWGARPKTPSVVGVHTQVEIIHIPFSSLVSLEESDYIYNCYLSTTAITETADGCDLPLRSSLKSEPSSISARTK